MGDVLKLATTTLCGSQQDVVDRIHDVADSIADGDEGEIRTVLVVIETMDGRLSHRTIGAPCDLARCVGLLHIESIRAVI